MSVLRAVFYRQRTLLPRAQWPDASRRTVARWLTRPGVACGAACGALLAVIVLWRYLAAQLTLGLAAAPPPQLGGDFINYWLGARFAAAGRAAAAYDRVLFYHIQQTVLGSAAGYKFYGYPPVAMLLSLPFAAFPFLAAFAVWTAAGATLCTALLARLVGWPIAAMAAIAVPAALLNVLAGQNGFFTAAILAGGLMLLERRPFAAGLVFGLLVYKPQLALVLPLLLLVGGYWRAVFGAAASALLLIAASAGVCGPGSWVAFLDQMQYQRTLLELPHNDWFRLMPTVFAALRLAGAPVAAAFAAQAASSVAATLAAALVWRAEGEFELKAAVLVTAAFLVTPYAWDYDMVVLAFASAWLVRCGLRTGFLWGEQTIALAVVALPVAMVAGGLALAVQIAPVVLWLLFAVLLRRFFAPALTLDFRKI